MWVQILLLTILYNYNLIKDIKFTKYLSNDFFLKKIFFFNYFYLFIYNFFSKQLILTVSYNYLTTKIFFKKKNFNKLYLNNDYLFLTPGIVLKFNNLFKKSFKIKTNLWNLFFVMFAKITNFKHIWFVKNFFFNLNKIFRNLIKFNLIFSIIYINLFKKIFFFKKNSVRRVKKWVKKKYFKVGI